MINSLRWSYSKSFIFHIHVYMYISIYVWKHHRWLDVYRIYRCVWMLTGLFEFDTIFPKSFNSADKIDVFFFNWSFEKLLLTQKSVTRSIAEKILYMSLLAWKQVVDHYIWKRSFSHNKNYLHRQLSAETSTAKCEYVHTFFFYFKQTWKLHDSLSFWNILYIQYNSRCRTLHRKQNYSLKTTFWAALCVVC